MRFQESSAHPSQSCGAWSAEGLARRESEESGPGGCCRGVGKSPGMTQPRMKERESRGREGRKTETGLSSIFARLQRGRGRVGLDARKAGLDGGNTIKQEEPLSWTVLRWRCSGCFWFLIYQESGKT